MRARRSGTIVNVSSVFAAVAFPGVSLYSASKSALEAFTQSLHLELKVVLAT
jgi:short-subunit dehydrogenase